MAADDDLAVDVRVRLYPDTDQETLGLVIEDFGEQLYSEVDVGDIHIAPAARRWAVQLDNGGLVFVNDDQLMAE